MAVAYDNFANGTAGTGDISFNITPVGTPRGVIVLVASTGASDEVSGVTYGGVAMSEVALSPVVVAGEDGNVSGWFLGSSIPTGLKTVTVTVSGSTVKQAAVITLTAGADTEVVDTSIISSTSQADPSVTVSLGGRSCFVCQVFYTGQGAVTGYAPFSGWTARLEEDFGSDAGGFYTYDTVGTVDVTAGYTATADDVALLAIAVGEVSAGGDVYSGRGVGRGISRGVYR